MDACKMIKKRNGNNKFSCQKTDLQLKRRFMSLLFKMVMKYSLEVKRYISNGSALLCETKISTSFM